MYQNESAPSFPCIDDPNRTASPGEHPQDGPDFGARRDPDAERDEMLYNEGADFLAAQNESLIELAAGFEALAEGVRRPYVPGMPSTLTEKEIEATWARLTRAFR